MGRLLFFIALIALTVYLVRKLYFPATEQKSAEQNSGNPELMKKCEMCDLHLPLDKGLTDSEGHFFCSQDHLSSFGQD